MHQIIHGDALRIVPTFQPGTFDAIITDPPYSSGGLSTATRLDSTSTKYTGTKKNCPMPDFEGDARDQRSWTSWCAEWLSDARRVSKPGAPVCVFCDWRQYPSLTDALQWAGWTWRGVAVWNKVSSRPQRGRFRNQCEYIVWGSNGPFPIDRPVPCLPGEYTHANVAKRLHQTEKPLELMRKIVRICEPSGLILDPFAGSGTTVLAAKLEGYGAVGIELHAEYARIATERVSG